MPIAKFALVMTTVYQFQKISLELCMVFTQKFEFCFQNFTTQLLNLLRPLSLWFCKIKINRSYHDCIPKGLTNFECVIINFHKLKYHSQETCKNQVNGGEETSLTSLTEQTLHTFQEKSCLWGVVSKTRLNPSRN